MVTITNLGFNITVIGGTVDVEYYLKTSLSLVQCKLETVETLSNVGNDHTIRNGSFRKLKIARESIDLAKVLPESNL